MNRSRKPRPRHGSQFAEMWLGLGVILLVIFFPMVDMLSIGVSYGLCMVLNNNQAREARLLKRSEATAPSGQIKKGIPDMWLAGLGKFVKTANYPQTELGYRSGASDEQIVTVATTITCNPLLPVPLPIQNVPGLNGPATFTISTERTMENPDYANQ